MGLGRARSPAPCRRIARSTQAAPTRCVPPAADPVASSTATATPAPENSACWAPAAQPRSSIPRSACQPVTVPLTASATMGLACSCPRACVASTITAPVPPAFAAPNPDAWTAASAASATMTVTVEPASPLGTAHRCHRQQRVARRTLRLWPAPSPVSATAAFGQIPAAPAQPSL